MTNPNLLPGFQTLIKNLKNEVEKKRCQNEIITWEGLMKLRLQVNEKLDDIENQELSCYEEKISMKNIFEENGVPTSKVWFFLLLISVFRQNVKLWHKYAS